uniref:glycosyltransferase family 2 protein n=1 Tax=Paenibacillus oryzisoli TaxID=1850517 RepID=UPI003D2893B8
MKKQGKKRIPRIDTQGRRGRQLRVRKPVLRKRTSAMRRMPALSSFQRYWRRFGYRAGFRDARSVRTYRKDYKRALSELWAKWAKDQPPLMQAAKCGEAAKGYVSGFSKAMRARRPDWVLPPPKLSTAAIVTVPSGKCLSVKTLEQLNRLPLSELIVIAHGTLDRALEKARKTTNALVIYSPDPVGEEEGRNIGARITQSDILLFASGNDESVSAERLVPFIQEMEAGAPDIPQVISRRDTHHSASQDVMVPPRTQLTSIIIPTYNGLPLLKVCVASIRRHTDVPYELIVVDNGSSDGTAAFCMQEKIKLIAAPVNLGFPAACNLGLRLAEGSELMLLNNDTIVTRNWLTNLQRCLHEQPNVGMVGPVTNYASGRQRIRERFTTIVRMTDKYNEANPQRWVETKRLIGMCLLFKREMLEKIGYLDERFSPGHFEDDDYCYRARLHGYRLLIAGDCFIYHKGSVSFRKKPRPLVRETIWRNRQKFIRKWGVDPRKFM